MRGIGDCIGGALPLAEMFPSGCALAVRCHSACGIVGSIATLER